MAHWQLMAAEGVRRDGEHGWLIARWVCRPDPATRPNGMMLDLDHLLVNPQTQATHARTPVEARSHAQGRQLAHPVTDPTEPSDPATRREVHTVHLTIDINNDSVTVEVHDIHPIAVTDVCQHAGDLALRLHHTLHPADNGA